MGPNILSPATFHLSRFSNHLSFQDGFLVFPHAKVCLWWQWVMQFKFAWEERKWEPRHIMALGLGLSLPISLFLFPHVRLGGMPPPSPTPNPIPVAWKYYENIIDLQTCVVVVWMRLFPLTHKIIGSGTIGSGLEISVALLKLSVSLWGQALRSFWLKLCSVS